MTRWNECNGKLYKNLHLVTRTHLFRTSVFLCLFLFYFFSSVHPGSLAANERNISIDNEHAVITAIEVEGLSRIDEEDLIDLICFEIGDVLDMDALRKGIRRAFRTGIFSDIQVLSEQYNGGTRLRYRVKEISVVNKIIIHGNSYIGKKDIKKVFLFREGDDLREELLDRAREKLLAYYDRRGHAEAGVSLNVIDTGKPAAVNIQITITEGEPLIVTSIKVPAEARPHMKTVEHSIFDREVLDRDLKKIGEYYRKKKYIHPEIGPYSFDKGELTIPVAGGPRLTVVFSGNRSIRSKKLEKLLSFIEEGKVNDELVAESAERIRNMYIDSGFYNTVVDAALERKGDIKVVFSIKEGERVVVDQMTFEGMTISESAVMKVLGLRKGKSFNENQLDEDIESIKNFYIALGYIRINIADVKKDFRAGSGKVGIHFIIEEGPQAKIASVDVTGNESIGTGDIFEALRMQEDTPYNLVDIGDARFRLLSLYKRRGFAGAVVNVKSTMEQNEVHLVFQVKENSRYVIGKIILQGNRKTNAKIIRRELTFEEGDIYNHDEIRKVKQRLYRLGIFSEVLIKPVETGDMVEGQPLVDLIIAVKEGKAGSVEFSLGYADYERLRGMFDISYGNLGGYNRRIGFKTEHSWIKERYVFHFEEPWLFNEPDIPMRVSLLKENRRAINLDTRELLYKIDKIGLLVGIEKPLTEKLTLNFGYEYSFTDTKDVEEGVILSREDTGTLGISSISPSLLYDGRDNPFDPRSGSLLGITVKLATRAFLSEVGFVKTTFKGAWYVPLHKRVVYAFSLGGGAAFSFEQAQELPLIERYFLGGRTTVRGYEHDMLGPKGQDDLPTGGNMFALIHSELRFSIIKGFGLVTFIDGGNVWQTSGDINEDLRYTAGAGLRYKTPVGPIRIDYGHKISRREGESAGEVHFSFGHAF
jgi:outer membrane protein insertion porin family